MNDPEMVSFEKVSNNKGKRINLIQYIKIDFDGFYYVLYQLRRGSKTIKDIINSSGLVSRDFIYERFKELRKLGYIEQTGKVEHETRKGKMQGHYYRLTERGQILLCLKQIHYKNKDLQYPEEFRFALF